MSPGNEDVMTKILYNSLNSEECYNSINNSSNQTLINMLVINYNYYHGLKSKDLEELIQSLD